MDTPENSDMEEDSLAMGSDSFSTERLSTQVGHLASFFCVENTCQEDPF